MTTIHIRRAQASDLPTIIAMLADDALGRLRENPSEPNADSYTQAFAAIDADPNQFLAVMMEDEAVVGTLQLSFIRGISRQGALRGQIEGVRIAAGRQGAGLGKRLIEWAVAECRRRGCVIVQLTTDKSRADAHRFYERLGFTATHLGYKLALS